MPLPDLFPPLFFGIVFSLALFGVVVLQTWNYFNSFHNDNLRLKVFVGTVFLLDLANSIFIVMWCYRVFVTHWADESFLAVSHWTLFMDPIFAGVVAAIVQVFFALRINVLLGRRWISIIIYVLAAATLCGGVGSGVSALKVGLFSRLTEVRAFFAVWLWSAVSANIIIVASMSHYIYKHKQRISNTETATDRALGVLVQNGLITAILAIVQAILFHANNTPYHLAISFVMPKVYAIMALSSLHSRKVIMRPEVVAVPSQGGAFTSSTYATRSQTAPGVLVNVETTATIDYNIKEEWLDSGSEKGAALSPSSVSSVHDTPPSSRPTHATHDAW